MAPPGRSLAAEATPGPWFVDDYGSAEEPFGWVSPHGAYSSQCPADNRLIALAPDLAVLCADAIDALEQAESCCARPSGTCFDRSILARFAALQPDNTDEAASEDPTAGLPADLVSALRDPNVVVPQDAALFDLLAKWKNAPSDTASAETPEGEGR